MSEWYCLRIDTNCEFKVAAFLAERRFTWYLPLETRWHTPPYNRKREPRDFPLWAGHLFVLVDEDRQFAELLAVEGVQQFVRVVRADGVAWPLVFPAGVMLRLQADEYAGLFDETRQTKVRYQPKKGDRVQVTAGIWLKFFARVLSTPRGERVHVMIEGPFGRGEALDVRHVRPAAA